MRFSVVLAVLALVLSPDVIAQVQTQRISGDAILDIDVDDNWMVLSRGFDGSQANPPRYVVEFYEMADSQWRLDVTFEGDYSETGESIALNRDWAAVGDPDWGEKGRIRLYRLENGEWALAGTLSLPAEFQADYKVGHNLAISEEWLFVFGEAERESPERSAVFIYEFAAGEWTFRQQIQTSSKAAMPVFISGTIAAVGPSVYRLQDGSWVKIGVLDRLVGMCEFGLAGNGNRIVLTRIAATCDGLNDAGAVFLYSVGDTEVVLVDSIDAPREVPDWGRSPSMIDSRLLIGGSLFEIAGESLEHVLELKGSHSVDALEAGFLMGSVATAFVGSDVYTFDLTRSIASPVITHPADGSRVESLDPLEVRLAWDPVPGASGYVVDASHGLTESVEVDETTVDLRVRAIDVDTLHLEIDWQVSAILEDGISAPSNSRFIAQVNGFDMSRFSPIDEGNLWMYAIEETTENASGTRRESYLLSFEILLPSQRENDGIEVERRVYTPDGALTASTHCSVISRADGEIVLEEGCEHLTFVLPHHVWISSGQLSHPGVVQIGPVEYEVDATGTTSGSAGGLSQGGSWFNLWGSDVGLVTRHITSYSSGNPGAYSRSETARLQYARIGGYEYGSTSVSSEPEVPARAEQLLIDQLYPNPAMDEVNVLLRGASAGLLTVELYDVTGRRILKETLTADGGDEHILINLPAGSSGLVLIRVTDSIGTSSSSRFVRLRGR